VAAAFCALTLTAVTARAQVTTGTISGTVTGDKGAVVPQASVQVRHMETGTVRTVSTDARGWYRATTLAVGPYEVHVEATGLAPELRRGINLTVGQEAVVDFALTAGAVDQVIEVMADAPGVHTGGAALSYLVDEKKIRDLPLNGRSFTQLALLQPGVQVFKQERTGLAHAPPPTCSSSTGPTRTTSTTGPRAAPRASSWASRPCASSAW
jgi:hypothetical protein